MADVETLMSVSAGDIDKVMGVAVADIESVMGLGIVTATWHGTRGVGGGGNDGGGYNNRIDTIQYKAVRSAGNTSDFGDMAEPTAWTGSVSNTTRGVFMGGYTTTYTSGTAGMEYITVGSTGNTTDFGDLTAGIEASGAGGNGVRGLQHYHSNTDKQVDYITIASVGDAADFGDTNIAGRFKGAWNNATRVGFCGGVISGNTKNDINYFTVATTGNSSDFGDMSTGAKESGCLESDTRACINIGYTGVGAGYNSRAIDYVAPASTGNGSDFGDMLSGQEGTHIDNGLSNLTRGEWWGGENSSGEAMDEIQYITIASTGNSTDAGNLLGNCEYGPGCLSGT